MAKIGVIKNDIAVSRRTMDDLEKDISKEINTKFGLLRRVIGRAKWRGYFSSSRNKNVTFGKWS